MFLLDILDKIFPSKKAEADKTLQEEPKTVSAASASLTEQLPEPTPEQEEKTTLTKKAAPGQTIQEEAESASTINAPLPEQLDELTPGQEVEATLTQLTEDGIWVDFNYSLPGFIPYPKWAYSGTYDVIAPTLQLNSRVKLAVISTKPKDYVLLSKIKIDERQAWEAMPDLAKGEVLPTTVKILGTLKNTKGEVKWLTVSIHNGLKALMPISHYSLHKITEYPLPGQEVEAEIIDINKERKRIVVSRRAMLKRERQANYEAKQEANAVKKQEEAEALSKIEVGSILTGIVTKIVQFGVFVQISENITGLVHNTELSWDRSVTAEDLVHPGDEIKVYVKQCNPEKGRLALSLKALQEDPWVKEVKRLQPSSIVSCKIVKLLGYGAIAKISPHVEGLIHISEITTKRIKKPEDFLELGQIVQAKILRIDMENKKVSLSSAQVQAELDE